MRKNVVYLALPFVLVAACNRSDRVEREQPQYDVVQEGAATGGTSTALGAGAVTPLTGTNADTTTDFTLDPRLSTAPPIQEPTIASGMPDPAYGSSPAGGVAPAYDPAPPPRRQSTSPVTREPVRQEPAPTRARTEPATPPTSTYPPPSEPTDTATATDTGPPPAPREKPSETPPPTTTDTAPPPTTTDTRGATA